MRQKSDMILDSTLAAVGGSSLASEWPLAESIPNCRTTDPQVVEDQLRKRARLRVKLAAEKRGISGVTPR